MVFSVRSLALWTAAAAISLLACGESGDGSSSSTSYEVGYVLPVAGAENVSSATVVTLGMNKPIEPGFFDTLTLKLDADGLEIGGQLSYDGMRITFTPAALLPLGAYVTVIVESSTPGLFSYGWQFRTSTTQPALPLGVTSVSPVAGATDVVCDAPIMAVFNLPLTAYSLSGVEVRDAAGVPIPAAVNLANDGRRVVITPYGGLAGHKQYTVLLPGDVTSAKGARLGQDYTWSFTTVADVIAPRVVSTEPASDAAAATPNGTIFAYFSESLDPSTVAASTATLSQDGEAVAAAVTYYAPGRGVQITPSKGLQPLTRYTVTLGTAIADLAGNPLAQSYTWSFVTDKDRVAPSLVSVSPADGTADVPVDSVLTLTFSEDLDPTSVAAGDFRLAASYTSESLSVSVSGNVVTLTPTNGLTYSTSYTIELWGEVKDLAGNASYSSSISSHFTTPAPASAIELGTPISRALYDPVDNLLYGLNESDKKLVVVDLGTRTVKATKALVNSPSDLCIGPDRTKLYVVNSGATSITKLERSTLEPLGNIVWPAPTYSGLGTEELHYHIKCLDDFLLVVDAQWAPGLWKVSYDGSAAAQDLTATAASIGDLVLSSDQSRLYYWYQYGWSAGYAGSNFYRVDINGATLTAGEHTSFGYPSMQRDPQDTPIFLDEAGGRVIGKRYVVSADDLSNVLYTLPLGEEIYAADFAHGRIASKRRIYSLTDFNPVRTTGFANADAMFYDSNGTLYVTTAAQSKLYYLQP